MPDSALGSAFRSTCRICPPRRAPGCTAARHRSNSRCSTGSQCRCRRCDARFQWGHLWSRHRPGNPSCRWVQGSGCSPWRDSGGECLDKCRLRFRQLCRQRISAGFPFCSLQATTQHLHPMHLVMSKWNRYCSPGPGGCGSTMLEPIPQNEATTSPAGFAAVVRRKASSPA